MSEVVALTSDTFRRNVDEIRGRIEKAAESNRSSFASGLGDMVETLTAEIERLNAVIADRSQIPDRRIMQIATATHPKSDYGNAVQLIVLDDAGIVWGRNIGGGVNGGEWERFPALPSAADDLERLRRVEEHRKWTDQARAGLPQS